MDKLEKFIIENRDDFNIHEPNPAVWDRIQKSTKKLKTKQLSLKTIIWRAAVVLAIVGSAYTFWTVNRPPREPNIAKIYKQIPQLGEAEAYYSSMAKNKMNEINNILSDDPELKKDIMDEVNELDNMSEELLKDLSDNIATQEVVEAMVQNYRLKLEILEEILEKLQEREKEYIQEKKDELENLYEREKTFENENNEYEL